MCVDSHILSVIISYSFGNLNKFVKVFLSFINYPYFCNRNCQKMFFFNPRKPRRFTHHPVYWDPRKEDVRKREKGVYCEENTDDEKYIPRHDIREAFMKSSSRLRHKKSIFRRIFYLGVLLSVLTVLSTVIYFLYLKHF